MSGPPDPKSRSLPEKVIAMYDLHPARVRIGLLRTVPVMLAVYDSGRIAALYFHPDAAITIELRSVTP